jgi:hypothetical protein
LYFGTSKASKLCAQATVLSSCVSSLSSFVSMLFRSCIPPVALRAEAASSSLSFAFSSVPAESRSFA